MHVGTKKCVEWGFGYGESMYEVVFGRVPRNGDLSPSAPETLEHLFYVPSPDAGTEFRFKLAAKFGVGKSKLWVPGNIYPEIKGRWLN